MTVAGVIDRVLDVEPDELDEHGVAERVGISWEPPIPLIVAVGSYVGASFGVAILFQFLAGSFDVVLGPTGAGAATAEVSGRLASGQEVELTAASVALGWRTVLQVCLALFMAGPALLVAKRFGNGPSADLGLSMRWRDVPVGLAMGIAAQLLVPLLYLLLRPFIGDLDVAAEARQLTDQAADLAGVAALAFTTLVLAPISEEIYYRGLVLRTAERRYGPTVAVVGSSLFFAVTHGQLLQFPALLVFGVAMAAIALRTGRLGIPIAAHAGFNLTTVVVLLAAGSGG